MLSAQTAPAVAPKTRGEFHLHTRISSKTPQSLICAADTITFNLRQELSKICLREGFPFLSLDRRGRFEGPHYNFNFDLQPIFFTSGPGVKTERRDLPVSRQVELVVDLVMDALKSARGYEVSGCVTPVFNCDLLGEAHQEDPRDIHKFKVELQISEHAG
jgi:hypothetical protein